MKAIVVYESLWGNTASIAAAVAEGIGPEARAMSTGEAVASAAAGADLIVAGAPILGFRLPTDDMRESVLRTEWRAPRPADLSHPSMRSWLESVAPRASSEGEGEGGRTPRFAAFETGLWWSPGGATKSIGEKLAGLGYSEVCKGRRFVVKGRYGPLRDGELDKARAWGRELAQSVR